MGKKNPIPESPSILKNAKLSTSMKSKGREPTVRDSPKITHQSLHGPSPLQIPSIEEMDTTPLSKNDKTPQRPIVSIAGLPNVRKKRPAIVMEGVAKKIRVSTDNPENFFQGLYRYINKVSSSPASISSLEVSPDNSFGLSQCQVSSNTTASKIEPSGHQTSGSSESTSDTLLCSKSNKIDTHSEDSNQRVMRKRERKIDYSSENYNIMQSSLGAIGHETTKAKSSHIFGDPSDSEADEYEVSLGSKDSDLSKDTPMEVSTTEQDSDDSVDDTDESESDSEFESESEIDEIKPEKSNQTEPRLKGFYVRTKESKPLDKPAGQIGTQSRNMFSVMRMASLETHARNGRQRFCPIREKIIQMYKSWIKEKGYPSDDETKLKKFIKSQNNQEFVAEHLDGNARSISIFKDTIRIYNKAASTKYMYMCDGNDKSLCLTKVSARLIERRCVVHRTTPFKYLRIGIKRKGKEFKYFSEKQEERRESYPSGNPNRQTEKYWTFDPESSIEGKLPEIMETYANLMLSSYFTQILLGKTQLANEMIIISNQMGEIRKQVKNKAKVFFSATPLGSSNYSLNKTLGVLGVNGYPINEGAGKGKVYIMGYENTKESCVYVGQTKTDQEISSKEHATKYLKAAQDYFNIGIRDFNTRVLFLVDKKNLDFVESLGIQAVIIGRLLGLSIFFKSVKNDKLGYKKKSKFSVRANYILLNKRFQSTLKNPNGLNILKQVFRVIFNHNLEIINT